MTDNQNPGNFANRDKEEVKNIASKGGQTGTENSGFASMDSDKQREIASQGGKASGGSFEPGSEKAKEAGRKGGSKYKFASSPASCRDNNVDQVQDEPINDSSYSTKQNDPIPVTDDNDVSEEIDPETADSDEQLERDDQQAIDKDNILKEKTRGAAPSEGYEEPGDFSLEPDDN